MMSFRFKWTTRERDTKFARAVNAGFSPDWPLAGPLVDYRILPPVRLLHFPESPARLKQPRAVTSLMGSDYHRARQLMRPGAAFDPRSVRKPVASGRLGHPGLPGRDATLHRSPRGSNASRNPSPKKFSASNVLTSTEQGKTSSHQ